VPREQLSFGAQLRHRFLRTLSPAVLGAGAGYFYAKETLSPEVFGNSVLPGMYASTGAVILILSFRVFGLVRSMLSDFLGRDRGA
jgi:hypothetical protein